MKVKVSDIAIINRCSIGDKCKIEKIKYLDTGSIIEGNIIEYKDLQVGRDIIPSRAKRLVKDNTILYSAVRPRLCHYGILDKPAENTVVSTGFITIDAIKEKVDPYYLYCKLIKREMTEYLASIADTAVSSYPSINPSDLGNLEIDIIDDIHKQEEISILFKNVENKIKNNNKINFELESMAKTIYDYWFLQFEFPNEEGKPYKSSGGKMVWNKELGREIPEGWEVKNIFECMDVIYGVPLSTELFNKAEGIPVIRIRDILNNTVSAKTVEDVDEKYLSKKKDLLIGMDGNFHMNFWSNDGNCINQRIVRIRDANKKVSSLQAYYEIAPYIKAREGNVARSTVGHLSDRDMKQLKILVPDRMYIYKYFNSILEEMCINKSENRYLSSLRDFLLPLLMNGQVGFKENVGEKEMEAGKEEVAASVHGK